MERRKDLDFAKGVGILLMVLGHCYSEGNGAYILRWLYSFHMPLFFIIPGIVYGLYRRHTTNTFWTITKKKAKRLLIPYFFFATMTAIALCVLGRRTLADFGAYMWRIVTLQGVNAMWFIPCFLAVELIFTAANRAKQASACNAVIALAGIMAVCFPVLRQAAPGIQKIIIGSAFMSLGVLCAKIYPSRSNFRCGSAAWCFILRWQYPMIVSIWPMAYTEIPYCTMRMDCWAPLLSFRRLLIWQSAG